MIARSDTVSAATSPSALFVVSVDVNVRFRAARVAALGGGFNRSTQQLHEIAVLAFRSPASFSVVR